MLVFLFYIFIFSLGLRYFYETQRKFFKKGYYSFYELITGLPPRLSFYQLFLIRFLPPFLTSFVAYQLLHRTFNYNFLPYSLIGAIPALMNTIPSLIDIKTYKGRNSDKLLLRDKISSLYLIYFLYFLSFVLISAAGAYFSQIAFPLDIKQILPTKSGIIEGLWIAVIISILSKLNKQS